MFLVHFHGDRDYFECHEILEDYWKRTPSPVRSSIWVGLIQLAVALYHQRRQNFAGAVKLLSSAIEIVNSDPAGIQKLGLDPHALQSQLKDRLADMHQQKPYTSMNLPITDPDLLAACQQRCTEQGFTFGQPSELTNAYLLDKHKLRDRSEVIAERNRSLLAKRKAKEL
ncbi:DUF309 domain-containing protein [Brevibacillus fulvus]|uniref:Metal-dependent hydrolase n=2 Tax=Brevibacillus fulvus TaxID=1125967 RepID=A0A938XX99_9BACL|nr:putative metal-dependent hydrolase [Brevibacillus fulvus]